MSVNVVCGKCGELITNMKILKPLKDTLALKGSKCPACGEKLSLSEFELDANEK